MLINNILFLLIFFFAAEELKNYNFQETRDSNEIFAINHVLYTPELFTKGAVMRYNSKIFQYDGSWFDSHYLTHFIFLFFNVFKKIIKKSLCNKKNTFENYFHKLFTL